MNRMITAIFLSLMATSAAAQETLIERSDFMSAVATNILEIRLLSLQLKVWTVAKSPAKPLVAALPDPGSGPMDSFAAA